MSVLVFDDDTQVTVQGGSDRAFAIVDDSSDVLVFDTGTPGREVQEVPGSTDFVVFDLPTRVVELNAGADFLLIDPPKIETVVQMEGSDEDVLVLTPGGPPGEPGEPGATGPQGPPGTEPDIVDLVVLLENQMV